MPSGANLFSITGIKVMTSGIAFDCPDRLSHLRAFPYDPFKIYMIVPIVQIELNSIQAIEVIWVIQVVCNRLGSISIWSSWLSEHFLRRLGRSGRSRQSYGNQALTSWPQAKYFPLQHSGSFNKCIVPWGWVQCYQTSLYPCLVRHRHWWCQHNWPKYRVVSCTRLWCSLTP